MPTCIPFLMVPLWSKVSAGWASRKASSPVGPMTAYPETFVVSWRSLKAPTGEGDRAPDSGPKQQAAVPRGTMRLCDRTVGRDSIPWTSPSTDPIQPWLRSPGCHCTLGPRDGCQV